ncbi:sigma-54-dependent transcriptional regulator [Desulfofundulus thermocisternus]|jgi:DNA-binding NtrC family response regulator|uniref:sigma-54-dependent transcriptional regulator n=1 Tax=Desulfofundulus thermocisternus TaxID=42471 RepID=UPI00047F058F|nr:response regulator [Desulfofundulus thermocisternus]
MARVLVIDDEKGMCWALRKALEDEGHEVITAYSGSEGLNLLAKEEVDLVLLDIKMPGMSGLEVLEHIRKKDEKLPVIIMTALSSLPTALEALQRGASGYVTKPFQLNNLKETINKALSVYG